MPSFDVSTDRYELSTEVAHHRIAYCAFVVADLEERSLHWGFFDEEKTASKKSAERLRPVYLDQDSTVKSARKRLATMIVLSHDRCARKGHQEDHALLHSGR